MVKQILYVSALIYINDISKFKTIKYKTEKISLELKTKFDRACFYK